MGYKKIFSDKIPHIDYYINQNNVYFKEGDSVIKIDEFLKRKIFFTKENSFVIENIIENKLCIRDKISLSYIELNSEVLFKTIPLHFQSSIQIKYLDNGFIVLRNLIKENDWEIFCIDNFGEIIWNHKDGRPFFSHGYQNKYLIYLFVEEKKIEMKSITDDSFIWQLSFSELIQDKTATLNSEVIEINSKLYLIVLGSDSGGLFCVDVNSGKVLMHYPRVSRFLVKDENYIYSSKYENILCKINPITNEMEEWDVNELVKDNGFENIHDHRCTADNGLVYFTQTLGDNKAKFGILDTNKKELVYKYDFEPKNGGIGSIEVNNDRIYISTQDNTLHIFEKDKDLE
ncbi:hypothetical protein B4N84_10750 [Flavobacterium sp. IR1]|nr:hypothetical protein B4N84_10750 [Flavobacterium sp. IR1]